MGPTKRERLIATERVIPDLETSAMDGVIRTMPIKTLWLFGHGLAGATGVFLFPHLDAFLVFIVLTGLTICAGHSVGMHRLLIHRSFKTPILLEYFLVWLGVLVGMAGPFGMIRAHDMRDWHQRQITCPSHPSHGTGFWRDAWWQMCCEYKLRKPPKLLIEDRVCNDMFYRRLEQTWMAQQIPLAVVLFLIGGWAWVLWGISLRIFVSLVGHWMVGHYAHRKGRQSWKVEGLPVQGYNLPGLGLLTFGENWHGNHHAFPNSAQLGVEADQFDPGYLFILCLKQLGLAWDINLPNSVPPRAGLVKVNEA